MTDTTLKKEGTFGGRISPRSIDYTVKGLDLRACILCRFCVNSVLSSILELSKAQLSSAIS